MIEDPLQKALDEAPLAGRLSPAMEAELRQSREEVRQGRFVRLIACPQCGRLMSDDCRAVCETCGFKRSCSSEP